jgi:acyl-CoA dehydrogenase family protein 9
MSSPRKLSFAKSLFFGRLEESLIFPYAEPREGEKESLPAVLESLRKFLAEEVDAAKIDREHALPESVRKGLGELGILGITIPEEYGGFGMSQTAYCRVLEEICTVCGSTAVFVGGHASIGTKALVLYGSEEQKKRFLPRLASGEWTACYALTEPEAGSDAQGLRSTAKAVDGGSAYLLNGSKLWITNAGYADVFTVYARVVDEEPGGITCFILTKDMPGLVVGKSEDKLGLNGSATNPLTFENVKVPSGNIVGKKGEGFKIALNILNYGRMSLGAGCVGSARRMMREAAAHALQRRQFGRPIAEFEMMQEKLWRMATNIYVAESAVYLTAGMCDRGDGDFQLEAAVCKTFGTEMQWDAINGAMQIAGGIGFSREYPYERFLRDARVNMIFEGTNEIQRLFIAMMGLRELGAHLKGVADALKNPLAGAGTLAAFAGGKLRRTFGGPSMKAVHPSLHEEARVVSEHADILARKSEALLRHFGADIRDQEYLLERVADMAVDLFCLSAALSRATKSLNEKGEEAASVEAAMVGTFAREAWRRLRQNAAAIDENDDVLRGQVAGAVLKNEGYYPWSYIP